MTKCISIHMYTYVCICKYVYICIHVYTCAYISLKLFSILAKMSLLHGMVYLHMYMCLRADMVGVDLEPKFALSMHSTDQTYTHLLMENSLPLIGYGVATISRLLKIIGLFCKRAL